MQFTIARSALHRALALINHATVRGNTSLPLLAYLRLEVEQDLQQLRLQATNLEISVSVWTPIEEVDTPGVLAVPAKLLTDLVGSLEEGKLTFEIDLDVWKITLVHTKGQAIFMGQSAGEYPSIPLPEAGASVVSIPAMPFARAVRSAGVSLAHDDSRPALACFLLQGAMERLILATTDGRRVSESSVVLAPGQDAGQLGPLLIPGRALAELATVFSDTSFQLSLTPNRSQVLFSTPHLVCSAILQSGEFPNYRAVVPPQRALRVEVSTDELQRLVQQARIFTGAEQRAARFSIQPGAGITPGSLTLSTRNEAGNTYISAPALVRGESTTVSFDIQLIHEALQTVSTPKVVLEIGQATAARTPAPAGILMPIGGDNLHAFMSMKA